MNSTPVARRCQRADPDREFDALPIPQPQSGQLIQQRFRLLEVGRVEAFGEPVVHRREEVAGFGALTLVAPEAGEAGVGAQLPHLSVLSPRDRQSTLQRSFSIGSFRRAMSDKPIPLKPPQLRLVLSFTCSF